MLLSEDELIKRDSQRDIGKELLESVHQMKKGQVGFLHKVTISAVTAARLKAGLSESQLAELLRPWNPTRTQAILLSMREASGSISHSRGP